MYRISFQNPQDGETELDARVIHHSQVLAQLIAQSTTNDQTIPIPLINVTRKTYDHIVTFLADLSDDIRYTETGILYHDQSITLHGDAFNVSEQAKAFLQGRVRQHLSFLQTLDKPALLDFAHAAMYLDMPYVRDVACMYLANLFNDMSVAEVKAYISL